MPRKKPQLQMSPVFSISCFPDEKPENDEIFKVPSASVPKRKKMDMDDEFVSWSQVSGFSSSSTGTEDPSEESMQDYEINFLRTKAQEVNMQLMSLNPRLYLGLSDDTVCLLPLLEKYTELSKIQIFMALRKVRLNESIDILADIFGFDRSSISRHLNQSIPLLAEYLKPFIFWPDEPVIQSNVPIAFRANYSHVQSIVDCFEVEVQKPSNPVHQALTWSQYKKCNTMKFLISCTPDGHINFISSGFGGRASDTIIVENCGFLNLLKSDTFVMADRGFKHIESLLLDKDCWLVRPPSVETGSTMTKDEVRLTKIVASLRIHVERVIRRCREFSFIEPHACFHYSLLAHADSCVTIVCALSNLQGPIIAES